MFSRNEYQPAFTKKSEHKKDDRSSRDGSGPTSDEISLSHVKGPYINVDSRVDYDNPQKYHDEFDKKLNFDFKNGLSVTDTTKERSNSSSNETRTEDIEKVWRKCIRPGSIMARHLKISDELLKAMGASHSNTEQNSGSRRSFIKDLPRYCDDL